MINKQKIIMIGDATDKSTDSALKTFKESGIDTFVLYPNEKDHYGAIERCAENGLNVFIFGGSSVCELNKHFFSDAIGDFPNFIERYKKDDVDLNTYKNVIGLYMIDEPNEELFPLINEHYVSWHNQNFANKKLWHVNMLPSYAPIFSGEWDERCLKFEKYIRTYVDQVLSKVNGIKTLGVDHYPMREKKGVITLSDEWLYDLAVVGREAKRAGAIYSVCVQAYCDIDQKKVDCTGDIRFQLYTAMAFGASMFEFYAYSTLHGTLAMLDDNGIPTDIYYSVREAIKEVRSFEKEYLTYDWKRVKTYLPKDLTNNAFDKVAKLCDKDLDGVKKVNCSRETIISEFENAQGKKAYLVVNYGMPVLSKSNIVEVTFEKADKIVTYQNGRKEIIDLTDNKITLFLEAGQGVFIEVEK